MAPILLTGAGFSRNWGGWLANEAFEYLVGCPEVTPSIRNALWKNKLKGLGFEGALQDLRAEFAKHQEEFFKNQLAAYEQMLVGMFYSMNIGFQEPDFEPGRHDRIGPQPTNVRDFLCRFDAIFTLNQDTLLEQKYQTSDIREGSKGKWLTFGSPGIQEERIGGQPYARPGVFKPGPEPFSVADRQQPYFKLHGSSNWRQSDGSSLLIMGGNKEIGINNIPLLDWYRAQFREMVGQESARLMIIGYSFQDTHIDEMIEHVVRKGAKLFIIDPLGSDVLNQPNNPNADYTGMKQELFPSLIGASRRPLLTTLSTDTVEFRKLQRFFPLFP